jgi:hypothetical protein
MNFTRSADVILFDNVTRNARHLDILADIFEPHSTGGAHLQFNELRSSIAYAHVVNSPMFFCLHFNGVSDSWNVNK